MLEDRLVCPGKEQVKLSLVSEIFRMLLNTRYKKIRLYTNKVHLQKTETQTCNVRATLKEIVPKITHKSHPGGGINITISKKKKKATIFWLCIHLHGTLPLYHYLFPCHCNCRSFRCFLEILTAFFIALQLLGWHN